MIVDPKSLKLPKKIKLKPMDSECDAIIYEASIRDMTSQTGIGVSHPKKFVGFTEENEITKAHNTGFSYLKSLGVTHVQLMPVFDFGSVDECIQIFSITGAMILYNIVAWKGPIH